MVEQQYLVVDGVVGHQGVEGGVTVGALARLALRLQVNPAIGLQVVGPEGVALVGRDRVATAANVNPLPLRVVAGGRVDTPGRARAFRLRLLPAILLRVVEPDFLTAMREERLLPRRKV